MMEFLQEYWRPLAIGVLTPMVWGFIRWAIVSDVEEEVKRLRGRIEKLERNAPETLRDAGLYFPAVDLNYQEWLKAYNDESGRLRAQGGSR